MPPSKHYMTGDSIYLSHEKAKGLYYIKSGRVKIVRENEMGKNFLINLAGPDELIGFLCQINHSEYHASAFAVEPSELHFIPKQTFTYLMQNDIEFVNKVVEILCNQLSDQQTFITNIVTKDGRQLLASLLLNLDVAYSGGKGLGKTLIRLPKKDIAGSLGIAPETLSRYLGDFHQKGLIVNNTNSIEILDKDSLVRLSQVNE